MATPSSSATSPSPTATFASPIHLSAAAQEPPEQDHRKRAIEKFRARAEISNVTRSLRARLSYASYKAAHNISHVPLRDLEAQSQSQAQGGASTGALGGPMRRHGSMAPPPNVGPRTYYPAALAGASNAAAGGSGPEPRPLLAHSLFTSILAPPPAQQARTILNVADPPVPPPSRPPASPRPRTGKPSARSIAEGTRAMAKTRRDDKPEKRRHKRSLDKGKQRQRRPADDVDADGDVDMKAAATLTSLLLNHRPAGSVSSPRSSLDDSETGSTQSYAHFAQSAARNADSAAASTSAGAPALRRASATPPPPGPAHTHGAQTTPRPAPTDNEAADLMLFLATSPSPVRKDSRDLAAYRALNGARPKGRVLFPTAGSMAMGDERALARGGSESFTSSVGSIGGEMRGVSRPATPASPAPGAQLLPPPSLPLPPRKEQPPASPKAVYGQPPPPPQQQQQHQQQQQQTQAAPPPQQQQQQQADFNFNEFLNASPSPARGGAPNVGGAPNTGAGMSAGGGAGAGIGKPSLGLRADVGRKLFEEEQMRHHAHGHHPGHGHGHGHAQGKELGAGIDLVQQS
ncbi:hypothetical protein B0H17DRAFT_1156158 [Mycena rosella]|uniref:Uncharacterized protein n=1 Tax=Mycena rosella TaxID=1033263 RepID=A0AAD7GXX4_MYCRO|nr:hypothetical protein B0H17DRAFT_1156158 [Mycena rosella]